MVKEKRIFPIFKVETLDSDQASSVMQVLPFGRKGKSLL